MFHPLLAVGLGLDAEGATAMVVKGLAVGGGFLLGYFLGAAVAWALDRWAFAHKAPPQLKKAVALVAGVCVAVLLAMILFGEGGKGLFGNSGGEGDKKGAPNPADKQKAAPAAAAQAAATPAPAPVARPAAPAVETPHVPRPLAPNEERVPMSRLRRRIAERLKQAQNNAAMLTTFNEVDMGAVMALRDKYKEGFEKRHKTKLGFMGFFVRAAVQALKEIPAVNGEIDGGDIIFKNHYDIGVAVGTEQGLVVPVVRDADRLQVVRDRVVDFFL